MAGMRLLLLASCLALAMGYSTGAPDNACSPNTAWPVMPFSTGNVWPPITGRYAKTALVSASTSAGFTQPSPDLDWYLKETYPEPLLDRFGQPEIEEWKIKPVFTRGTRQFRLGECIAPPYCYLGIIGYLIWANISQSGASVGTWGSAWADPLVKTITTGNCKGAVTHSAVQIQNQPIDLYWIPPSATNWQGNATKIWFNLVLMTESREWYLPVWGHQQRDLLPPTPSPTTRMPTRSPTSRAPTTLTPTQVPSLSPTTVSPTFDPTTPSPTPSPPTPSPPTPNPTTPNPTTPNPTTPNPSTPSPTTSSPTPSPTTSSPTPSPTTSSPTPSPTTSSPTPSPTTSSPTPSPTTSSPTSSPTTSSPTTPHPTTPEPTCTHPTSASPTTRNPTTPSPTAPTPNPTPNPPTTPNPTPDPNGQPYLNSPTQLVVPQQPTPEAGELAPSAEAPSKAQPISAPPPRHISSAAAAGWGPLTSLLFVLVLLF